MDIRCIGCEKTPAEILEYIDEARIEKITPDLFVIRNEGTYNPENGHFCCTECYIKMDMPCSAKGWKAP